MKISHASNSWSKYSQALSDLVSPRQRLRSNHSPTFRKLRPFNQFVAWPSMPKRQISAQSGYHLAPVLDLKPIEQFLKRHQSLAHTEPLLRTSPLLSHGSDEWPGSALEKAVAIKRMASLMHETVSAMKSLNLVQASHHRG